MLASLPLKNIAKYYGNLKQALKAEEIKVLKHLWMVFREDMKHWKTSDNPMVKEKEKKTRNFSYQNDKEPTYYEMSQIDWFQFIEPGS